MRTFILRVALTVVVSTLLAYSIASAQNRPATQPSTQKSQFDREMTVSPAKAEDAVDPSVRADPFAFSQDALELRHENAATLYLQAFPHLFVTVRDKWKVTVEELEAKRLEELDPTADRKALYEIQSFGASDGISEPAVRRSFADWGAPIQEKGIETLLPYLAETRVLARTMALEANFLAREGKHEEAAEMLRRLYVLGQHVGDAQQPVLIDGLVGVGVAAIATDRAAQIAELKDAPNRYWALTTLPRPMFDTAKWMRSERIFITPSLPALRDPENMTSQEWTATLRKLREYMIPADNTDGTLSAIDRFMRDTAAQAALAAQARPYLKARGYTDARLDEMGVPAVIATYMMDDYRSRFDAIAKLVYLPFPQALPLLIEQEKRMTAGGAEPGPGLLADILLPAMTKALAAPYRLERQIAALRIVEAVRDHAAHHGGALPQSLDDVRLPIPEDPMTGEPFGYEASGDTFTITARRYDESDVNSGFVWRVTMRR